MNNDLISREDLKKAFEDTACIEPMPYAFVKQIIDNAPAITSEVEFVTKNGITFPKALETMTYSHELTTEERQNIEKAYMLGVHTNARPHGEWVVNEEKGINSLVTCPFCKERHCCRMNFCGNCGAEMRKEEGK